MANATKVEFFTDIILEKFYPDDSFLSELTDMDALSRYNMINLAECGADPDVVENNTTWPLTPSQRTDNGIEIPLATFDTKPTHVTNVEELETNYSKAESVLTQHVNTLREKCSTSAAFNLSPQQNTATTPVLATTGSARGDGKKRLTFADVLKLRTSCNKAKFPASGRILVLCPEHDEDLMLEDSDRYNKVMERGMIAGFKIYIFTENALYDPATKQKQPKGALTGNESSFFFCAAQVMRSMGDKVAKAEERFADYRGWLLGAQIRFVALPFRSKGFGVIYSANV